MRDLVAGIVALALIVGGIAILLIERWQPATRHEEVESLPPRTALGVGLVQVLALVPGVSRSGATILGGYALGMSRRAAAEFSGRIAAGGSARCRSSSRCRWCSSRRHGA